MRVTLYRRLLKVDTVEEAILLREETIDRFGKLPPSLKFLFDLTYVRTAAPDMQITKIVSSRDETIIYGHPGGKWQDLKLPHFWMKKLDGFVGPGGYPGMDVLSVIIQDKYSLNLLK